MGIFPLSFNILRRYFSLLNYSFFLGLQLLIQLPKHLITTLLLRRAFYAFDRLVIYIWWIFISLIGKLLFVWVSKSSFNWATFFDTIFRFFSWFFFRFFLFIFLDWLHWSVISLGCLCCLCSICPLLLRRLLLEAIKLLFIQATFFETIVGFSLHRDYIFPIWYMIFHRRRFVGVIVFSLNLSLNFRIEDLNILFLFLDFRQSDLRQFFSSNLSIWLSICSGLRKLHWHYNFLILLHDFIDLFELLNKITCTFSAYLFFRPYFDTIISWALI